MDPCRDLDALLEVSESARSMGIFVGYTIAWLERRDDDQSREVIEHEIAEAVNAIKQRYSLETLRSDPIVRAYRDFYWRIGVDPTKTRPSSEALVRRALRGSFPRINPVVDAGNIASARTLIPIGIYDLDRASPPFRIVLSQGGEVFKPIGGKEEVLPRGVPILIDSRGVVMHLYPHRDSIETCVTEETKRVLILGAGVPKVPRELVVGAVKAVTSILERIGWRSCDRVVVKGA